MVPPSSRGSWRAVASRIVVVLVVLAASGGVASALYVAAEVFRSAVGHRHETLTEAENRLFGEDYMASIRRIRATVGSEETVFLVDAQSVVGGNHYFVLHALAPRRAVLLGNLRDEPLRKLRRRLPPRARWVVIVGDGRNPPILETASEFRGR